MKKMMGVVKWFSPEKGFGFIQAQDMDNIYVHYSGISSAGFKSLTRSQQVEFELSRDSRGPVAVDVCIKNN